MDKSLGKIYLCATPIGNLEDVTYRLLRILKEVDLIAAEDTRQTRKLLSYYDIHTPLTSYHQHNERLKADELIAVVQEGKQIAVVSDAGVPGISDPGYVITQRAIENQIPIIPIPGPSAAITALVASGLPTDRFVFEGFLSNQKKTRREQITQLAQEERTIILYEAPHRLKSTLEDLLQGLGDRPAVVARELTKRYEEFVRGPLSNLVQHFQEHPPKGEIVLILSGRVADEKDATEVAGSLKDAPAMVMGLIQQGTDKKEAIKKVAKILGLPKRQVYQAVLDADNPD